VPTQPRGPQTTATFSILKTGLSPGGHERQATAPPPRDEAKNAIATLLSGEQAERQKLMEQMAALAARLDSLVTALDNLKISRGEIAEPSTLEAPAAATRTGRRGRRYR
jgi:hypothetical protein